MDHERQSIIDANIKRNLGASRPALSNTFRQHTVAHAVPFAQVFSVPRHLCQGDPYEMSARADARHGFKNNMMVGWWRENVVRECPPSVKSPPQRFVMDAHPKHAAQWAGEPRRPHTLQPPPPLLYGVVPERAAPPSCVPVYYYVPANLIGQPQ